MMTDNATSLPKLILKVDFEILQFLPEIKAVHAGANLVLSNRISALTFALCTANKFWHNTPSCNQETLTNESKTNRSFAPVWSKMSTF